MRERGVSRRLWLGVGVTAVIAAAAIAWVARPTAPHVQLVSVSRQTLQSKVFASGTVRSVQRQVVNVGDLAAPVNHFDVPTGAKVKVGDPLLSLQNSAQVAAVQSAEAAVSGAEQQLQTATAQYDAAPPLAQPQLKPAVIAARTALAQATSQLAQANAASAQTLVRAAINGTVLFENPGGIAPNGSSAPLLEVVSAQRQLVVDVSEVDAVKLNVGVGAVVTSDAFPGRTWQARITAVNRYASTTASGSPAVETLLSVPANFPVPLGYPVNVNILGTSAHNVPIIPYSALVQEGTDYAVFVYHDGRVQERTVTLGITSADAVQVVSGVGVGAAVVSNPPPTLTSGEAVNAS